MTTNLRMTRRGICPVAFFIVACLLNGSINRVAADVPLRTPPTIQTFRGATMGTTYMVKVSGAPTKVSATGTHELDDWYEEIAFAIDAELRRVNDQMSTYLKSSELSRFNDSDSTAWFEVSRPTAEVVGLALEIGEQTGGMLDVTVGPLVDRWNFGPGRRNQSVPNDADIDELKQRVGQHLLSVRLDPPALKKQVAALRVDLSAIAKGHGVDRVVALLQKREIENMFVEIGGEVRVTGQKQTPEGPQPWKVGIQKPDSASNQLALAHPMNDSAMATSGDYRNFFEVDGERYSHTLNPVTGRPVKHDLASVTVIADTCAEADGWATALNAAGPELAEGFANEHKIDSLLITRVETTQAERDKVMNPFQAIGTGVFVEIAERMNGSAALAQTATKDSGFLEQMMPLAILTAVGFGVVLISMAVGVMFGRKAIGGSCGGLNAKTDPDGTSRCSMCSTPSDGCKELRDKIAAEASHSG